MMVVSWLVEQSGNYTVAAVSLFDDQRSNGMCENHNDWVCLVAVSGVKE